MKCTKKILAVMLTLCMLLPLIQVGTFAASYTITFDADGGELVGPATYDVNVGDFYVDIFGEEAPVATMEGYKLVGWFCEKWNYWLDMDPSSYFAVNEDVTFVAVWEEAPVDPEPTPDPEPVVKDWTMYFDPDGGEMVGPSEYGINTGDFYADIFGETIPQATLEGYKLVGWYLEKYNFTLTDGDVNGGGYYAVAEDSYFVAVWEEAPVEPEPTPTPDVKPDDKSWTMTLDPDGGVMDEGFSTKYYFNTGDHYVDIMPAYPTASLEGYKIDGWYLEAWNYTFTQGDYETGYYALAEDCTLVAIWVEAPVEPEPDVPTGKDWTMYFDPDGGEMVGPTEYGVNTGDLYADIFGETIPQAILEGYVVVGWYAEKWNFTLTDGDVTGGGYYAVSEDCYFVAVWEEAPEEPVIPDIPDPEPLPDPDKPADKSWILTLDPDGGKMDEGFENYYYFNTGDEYVDIMPAYPTASLEGYNFMGWYLEAWNYT
ncbi:MAG: InlB B-repeat-containing protein, partial [Clostridia bacterium]|nr:InlB B-repeat-containing protein [Clostridia bacterium]